MYVYLFLVASETTETNLAQDGVLNLPFTLQWATRKDTWAC